VVPQNGVLLRADVRTNLTLGSSGPPSDEEMIEVLKEYGLYDRFNERDGLDTIVVDDLLSYAEQQIFYIARALLQKSNVVLLDEPTSR
jgi:ABC-type multidrug transport system fused ATPase/permease subunit